MPGIPNTNEEKCAYLAHRTSKSIKVSVFEYVTTVLLDNDSNLVSKSFLDTNLRIRFTDGQKTAKMWALVQFLICEISAKTYETIEEKMDKYLKLEWEGFAKSTRDSARSDRFAPILTRHPSPLVKYGSKREWWIPGEVLCLIGYQSNGSFQQCYDLLGRSYQKNTRDLNTEIVIGLSMDFLLSSEIDKPFAMDTFQIRDVIVNIYFENPLLKKKLFDNIIEISRARAPTLIRKLVAKDNLFCDLKQCDLFDHVDLLHYVVMDTIFKEVILNSKTMFYGNIVYLLQKVTIKHI